MTFAGEGWSKKNSDGIQNELPPDTRVVTEVGGHFFNMARVLTFCSIFSRYPELILRMDLQPCAYFSVPPLSSRNQKKCLEGKLKPSFKFHSSNYQTKLFFRKRINTLKFPKSAICTEKPSHLPTDIVLILFFKLK